MKKFSILLVIVLVVSIFGLSRCENGSDKNKDQDAKVTVNNDYNGFDSEVKWGAHLVTSIGCGDCHTPKKMGPMGPEDDSTLLLSGHPAKMPPPDVDRKAFESKGIFATNSLTAWVGPWGISYSANLTSDTTGLGMWSEEQFILAIREGKWKGMAGNRSLLPPMPWHSYRHMNNDELRAIFSYLKSTKPIQNIVPSFQLPLSAGNP